MRVYPEQILTNGSMAGSLTSSQINMTSYWGGCVSCVVTNSSAAAGTLSLQGSGDGINYQTLTSNATPTTLTVAGNGTYLFDVTTTGVQFLQLIYVPSGGTGTLNIKIYMKGY